MFSLSILQLVNYVFPFLTLPYLSRVLTTEHYGLVLFSLSFTAYFAVLCDYGFNLSAVKQVALNSKNTSQLNRIISAVTSVKIILFILSIILNLIIVLSVAKFREYWFIYLLNIGTIISNVFFPIWFFQGVEKMKYITVVQVIIRSINLALIFVLIHQDSQYFLWPVINFIGAVCSIIFAQYILIKRLNISYVRPNWNELKEQFQDGWYIFISTVAVSLYTISNSFFLGLLTNPIMVAYYVSAEKITSAIQGLFMPISQSIFPHLSKIVIEDPRRGVKQLQKAFFVQGIMAFLLSVFLFLCAPFIIHLVFGAKFEAHSTIVLRILSLLPFIVVLSNILGVQTMIPFGLKKVFSKILIISSLSNIVLIFILVPRYNYVGSAICVVITECVVTLMMFAYLYKTGVWIWYGKIKPTNHINV